ncbi:MAG: rod shape-determining protein MreD [Lachnospiraceae bacterium]|nr:rod shape-determining protein MreD [Lachnospiraceae bacterium]
MRRKILVTIIIIVCFLLQSTVFQTLSFASISPNLLIIVIASFGFMRGSKEGMVIGFFCGLLVDIFFAEYLGFYTLLHMYIGWANGFFKKHFFPDDIALPMVLISCSDLIYNLAIYFFRFLFRSRFSFGYYLIHIMIPEIVYTLLISIVVYFVILKINQRLEHIEKRSASKFV